MANSHSIVISAASAQYLYVADNANLSITGNITIECWVKFASLPSQDGYASQFVNKWYGSAPTNAYMFRLNNDGGVYKLAAYIHNGTNFDQFNYTFTPSLNVWYYFAFTWKASDQTWNIYKGDQSTSPTSVASGTGTASINSIQDSNDPLQIGSNSGFATDNLDAKIDDIRIWATVRTQTELQNNYKRELAGNESNLRFYAKLNNNYNDSANGNTLTPSGTPTFTTDVPFDDTTTTSTSTTTTSTSTTTSSSTSTTTTSTSTSSSSSTTQTNTSTSTTRTTTSTTTTSTSTTSTSSSTTTTSTSTSITTSSSTSTSTTVDYKLIVEKVK